MRYSRKTSFCGRFLIVLACSSAARNAFSQVSLPPSGQFQNDQSGAGLATPATNDPVAPPQLYSSFIDPRNGIIYDRYIETQNVPTYQVVTEQKMERRWIPEMQTETLQVTQVQYVPTVSLVSQPTSPSILRPFSQPQYQYVQKVDYVPVNKVVSMPVSVQRYVEREIPVQVQKTVKVTSSVKNYVDRARPGQSMANAAPNYATTPIGSNVGYSNVLPNSMPVYPVATSPTIAPTTNYQPAAPYAGVASQNSSSLAPLVPIQNAYSPAYNTTAAGPSPWNKFTNWISGNGPLFNNSAFQQNQLLPTNSYASSPGLAAVGSPSVGFGGSVAYAYQPTGSYQPLASQTNTSILPSTQSSILPSTQSAVMPPQQLAGRMTILPSTSPSTSRTATQTGMPATEFR